MNKLLQDLRKWFKNAQMDVMCLKSIFSRILDFDVMTRPNVLLIKLVSTNTSELAKKMYSILLQFYDIALFNNTNMRIH